jgi:hypothetical protein
MGNIRQPHPIPKITAATAVRFWTLVDRSTPEECWLWRSYKDADGRGRFKIGGTEYKAPRLAYFLSHGVDLGSLNANHSCDNPACCNPAHLWPGTQQDGMRDMQAKGRNPKGSRHGNARLTEQQVSWIRQSPLPGRIAARLLNVSDATISMVRSRRRWGHVA